MPERLIQLVLERVRVRRRPREALQEFNIPDGNRANSVIGFGRFGFQLVEC